MAKQQGEDRMITVVSGLPRSGTSLMMQMLDAGGLPALTDRERQADESNPQGYYECEQVKSLQKDSSWLGEAEGKAVKIISYLIPHLPPAFEYRMLIMNRPIDEVLRSQEKMLIRLGRPVSPSEQLKPAFLQQLVRAKQWMHDRQVPYLDIQYHELVQNPEPVIERVVGFLDRSIDPSRMIQAVDPRLWRERG
jgi:hypothetical protein